MSKIGYNIYRWDDKENEFRIVSNRAGRQILCEWCENNLNDWAWREGNDYGNDHISTVFRFSNKEDAVAFKLRWAE